MGVLGGYLFWERRHQAPPPCRERAFPKYQHRIPDRDEESLQVLIRHGRHEYPRHPEEPGAACRPA